MRPSVEVVELAPLRAATLLWRPHGSGRVLTVIAKATYVLDKGIAALADVQDDVNERDLHTENNTSLGLHSASDMVPYKPHADVTLVGKAYSPPRELARVVVARLKVGPVDKQVEVHAERQLTSRGEVKDDKFFSKMPLGYDRAPGGPGTANPAGMSLTARPDSRGRIKLPNLCRPGEAIQGPATVLSPVGFGPIPAGWPERSALLRDVGAFDGVVDGHELPARLRWEFFNVAPRDQRLEQIHADERIHLEHLHPEHPVLDTQLPGLSPRVFVQQGDEAHRIPMRGDTLWIDTNRLVMTLTWRGQMPLDEGASAKVYVAASEAGNEPGWEVVWHMAEAKRRQREAAAKSDRKTKPQAPASIRGGPMSMPRMTTPVSVGSNHDHSPEWLPPPVSSQSGSLGSDPAPESGLVIEVSLSEREARMLSELGAAMGYDAATMLRQALHEAYAARRSNGDGAASNGSGSGASGHG